MTVCVAALANDANAIVCVADKALSYGDHIQWDSDSTKILKLNPSGTLVMFSGGEQETQKVLANIISVSEQIGARPRGEIVRLCEQQYKDAVDDLVEAQFLRPRLLDRNSYLRAITGGDVNHMMRSLADEIRDYEVNCGILVCGFDDKDAPFIIDISSPGVATDFTHTGFHAIGSGWDKAVSRLLFSQHKRKHLILRVLYDAFDAKANAEMSAGVGHEWDAVVSVGGVSGSCDMTDDIKTLIERVWAKFNRSPFDKFNSKKDLANPPKDWRKKLASLISEQIRDELRLSEAETGWEVIKPSTLRKSEDQQ